MERYRTRVYFHCLGKRGPYEGQGWTGRNIDRQRANRDSPRLDSRSTKSASRCSFRWFWFLFSFSFPLRFVCSVQAARNIRNLPCVVKKSGLKGVCMFAIDCIKTNGTHLGTCIDRFYFGSCCQMKVRPLIAIKVLCAQSEINALLRFSYRT